MPHFTIHEWKAVRQKVIESSNAMHAYCGDSPFMAVFGCQTQVVLTCHSFTKHRGVQFAAEIRDKIRDTCSIHEMRNTKSITDNTVHWAKKSTNNNYSNGEFFTYLFGILSPLKTKITTIIVINIIWHFCHIRLRSCSTNHSILIKGTGSSHYYNYSCP
jgi:hypothetical protein